MFFVLLYSPLHMASVPFQRPVSIQLLCAEPLSRNPSSHENITTESTTSLLPIMLPLDGAAKETQWISTNKYYGSTGYLQKSCNICVRIKQILHNINQQNVQSIPHPPTFVAQSALHFATDSTVQTSTISISIKTSSHTAISS